MFGAPSRGISGYGAASAPALASGAPVFKPPVFGERGPFGGGGPPGISGGPVPDFLGMDPDELMMFDGAPGEAIFGRGPGGGRG